MIVLDTNVLSEMMRAQPETKVIRWLDTQDSDGLLLTAITVAEILYGIHRLPDGKRKNGLREVAMMMFNEDFAGRILAFDTWAAAYYAELVTTRERAGRPTSMGDAQIAAICRNTGASLATRNIKHFEETGIELVDPWQA